MSRRLLAAWPVLAATVFVTIAPTAHAGGPYEGWRGQPASQPSYAGAYGSNRRPLDGSYRAASSVPIWSGLYVGGHLGGGWGNVVPNGIATSGIATNGVVGGVHAGFNFQQDRFVAGVEVDWTLTDASGSASYAGGVSAATDLNWLSSARLRMGYAFDNVLLYGTGGLAMADLNIRTTALGVTSNTSEIMTGYVLGAGVEMKFAPNVSARLEALHYRFGDERYGTSAGVLNVDKDITTVRAGLSLHLN